MDIWLLRMMVSDEYSRVFWEFSDTAACFSRDVCLHDLFCKQVELHPQSVAVEWKDQQITYTELDVLSDQLASRLEAADCSMFHSILALQFDKCLDMALAILGVLKSGCAFLPIDPSWPLERKQFILQDACCRYVITQEQYVLDFTWFSGNLNFVSSQHNIISQQLGRSAAISSSIARCGPVVVDKLAYVIYTSGSTGQPKGVMVPHRCAVSYLRGAGWFGELCEVRRFSIWANYVFDMFCHDFFLCLCRFGSAAVFIDIFFESSVVDDLGQQSSEVKVDALTTVPSVFPNMSLPSSVQVLTVGGEFLTSAHMDAIIPSGCSKVFNIYGPTESTISVVSVDISNRATFEARPASLGNIHGNTVCYVINHSTSQLQLQPIGVYGELLIGGAQVTQGYLNRQQLTDEKFVTNPWCTTDPSGHEVIYRTGDKVRWYDDGEVEFAGRLGFQVKLRGYRIELGEIENALRAQKDVQDTVVLLRDDIGNEPMLAAYIQPAWAADDVNGLKCELSQTLPSYMVPSFFVGMDYWPRTSSGKIDRMRLPIPDIAVAGAEVVAARNYNERLIVGVYADVLGLDVDCISVDADFFSLGGNSLVAVRVVAILQDLNRGDGFSKVGAIDVLQHATAARLAQHVESSRGLRFLYFPPIEVLSTQEDIEYAVSWNQSQLLTIYALDESSAAYNIPMGMWIHGSICMDAIRASLVSLQERHMVLRSTFGKRADGEFVQVVLPSNGSLRVEDVNDKSTAISAMSRDVSCGFELFGGPVFRSLLVHVRNSDVQLCLLNVHHIAFDGMSMGIFIGELSVLYTHHHGTFVNENVFDPLHIQYVDFARWQNSVVQHALMEQQRSYWKTQLRDGKLPVLEFPADKTRPPVQTFRGVSIPFAISAALVEKLHSRGVGIGMNPFRMMLSLWALLLCRHSGQDEVVVGVPYHGRDQPELQNLIGYFVNMLSIRIDTPYDCSVDSYLHSVRSTVMEAMENAQLPFQSITNDVLSQMQRDPSRNGVFQTMFAWGADRGWEGSSLAVLDDLFGADVVVSPVREVRGTTSKCDLSLLCNIDVEGCISGVVEFSSDLFHERTVHRLLARMNKLLAIVVCKESAVGMKELDFMPIDEAARVTFEFNDTAVAFRRCICLHDVFSQRVLQHPNSPAVEMSNSQLTYTELDQRSNRVAYWLRDHGIDQGSIVALQLKKSLDMPVAILGVLKSGGAVMPLDPTWSLNRREFMLRDAECQLSIVQERYREDFIGFQGSLLAIDSDEQFLKVCDYSYSSQHSYRPPEVGANSLAIVLYTSGSTGQPKGVRIPHRVFTNALFGMVVDNLMLTDDFRMAVSANYIFDAFYMDLFLGLGIIGGSCVFLESGLSLLDLDDEESLHALADVPSLFMHARVPKSVRQVFVRGEKVSDQLLCKLLSSCPVHNGYGPTEVFYVTQRACSTLSDFRLRPASIGHPLSNIVSYVAEPNILQLQPIGVWGELFIGGVQVTDGYLDREGLTSERYILNGWCNTDPSGRGVVYRTGDKVRWSEDGELEFSGRYDSQIKLRGYRIELSEIEHVLRSQQFVGEAVVVARSDVGTEPVLIGYLHPAPAANHANHLRQALADVLPPYMVPSMFVGVEEWPRTSSGKISRKNLPFTNVVVVRGAVIVPRNDTERLIVGVYADVLGLNVESISVDADFFSLGGNSLIAVRVAAALQNFDGIGCVGVMDVLQHATVATLAQVIGLPRVQPSQETARTEFPVSFVQSRLLKLHVLDKSSPAYHNSVVAWIPSASAEALRAAFRSLCNRHSALRSTFRKIDDEQFVQVVKSVEESILECQAVRDKAEALEAATADAITRFDLFGGSVLRCRLFQVECGLENLLVVNVHSVCFDDMSAAVLFGELHALYKSYAKNESDPHVDQMLSELPFQYVDFAVWQLQIQDHEILQRQRAYWRTQLRQGDLPVLAFPSGRSLSDVQSFGRDQVAFTISSALVNDLNELSEHHGCSMMQICLICWSASLCLHSGQQEIVVGIPYHGRESADWHRLIGNFTNDLSILIQMPRGQSYISLLKSVRKTVVDAMTHSQLPFDVLVDELLPHLDRSAFRHPVFQTRFNWKKDLGWIKSLQDLSIDLFDNEVTIPTDSQSETAVALCELNLTCSIDSADCIQCTIDYNGNLYEVGIMEKLASDFQGMLRGVIDGVDSD